MPVPPVVMIASTLPEATQALICSRICAMSSLTMLRSASSCPAASHRRAAFEACDYLMDYLKSRAPFWKKETGPDGSRWIEPRDQDHADIARWETTKP